MRFMGVHGGSCTLKSFNTHCLLLSLEAWISVRQFGVSVSKRFSHPFESASPEKQKEIYVPKSSNALDLTNWASECQNCYVMALPRLKLWSPERNKRIWNWRSNLLVDSDDTESETKTWCARNGPVLPKWFYMKIREFCDQISQFTTTKLRDHAAPGWLLRAHSECLSTFTWSVWSYLPKAVVLLETVSQRTVVIDSVQLLQNGTHC